MEFLYPEFNNPTHKLSGSVGISIQYPKFKSFEESKDYIVKQEALVVVIRENVGYNCDWALARVIDSSLSSAEYYNKDFYILTKNLINIGNKETYVPVCSEINNIDETAETINPIFKETFIPYVDKKNGLYSVRIQVDYEKILDMGLFKKVLEEVYLEGVNVLLSSRGFRSDNDTINSLKNKYYTFAYIQKDLDLTVRRSCEPLTFTVSIPLNFFNQSQSLEVGQVNTNVVNYVTFTNLNFIEKIDNIMSLFSSKSEEIKTATYPDKIIENFILEFELNSLKSFAIATNEIMALANSPIDQNGTFTEYTIGLSDKFDIVSIAIKKKTDNGYQELSFTQALLAQCRLRSEFNNKRIFNYFINLKSMIDEISSSEIIKFLKKYVIYPNVRLIEESITINGIDISPQKVKEFRMSFSKNSESCVRLTDVQNLLGTSIETAQFADPIFHLFVPSDPKNDASIGSITKDLQDNISSIQNYYKTKGKQVPTTGGGINFDFSGAASLAVSASSDVGSQFVDYAKEQYQSNLNTFGYVLKRLDIQEIIFKNVLCALKGTDPNATETAKILSEIPIEVINYLTYIESVQSLKGLAYIKALEEGFTFDMQLFCNDEVAYFIKGLTNILRSVNAGINATLTFVKEIDVSFKQLTSSTDSLNKGRAFNPYSAIVNSVAKTLYVAITDFLFEWARDLLTAECDDPIYDKDPNNFSDPFGTHTPIERFNSTENNNLDNLKKYRTKALKETLPDVVRELQYGVDLEYTIDIIDLLIKDVKCILSPMESVNLLRGKPSEEVIVIIKNIIRNKYSKEPNNLSYLLNNDTIVLFFKKLGLTVDQDILEQVEKFSIEKVQRNDVCTPEQYATRKEILDNKIPPSLGILEQDTKNRVQKARRLLEKVKNGETVYKITALCPEVEDEEISNLKSNMVQQYIDSVRSIFSNTLTNFTDEAVVVNKKFTEEKHLVRMNGGNIFDDYVYNNYNSNLASNMQEVAVNKISDNVYKILYNNLSSMPLNSTQIADIFLKSETLDGEVEVCSGSFIEDKKFTDFLSQGRIIWENRPWSRSWDTIKEQYKQRGFKTLDGRPVDTNFVKELSSQQADLFEYIKEKGSVIFISSETSGQEDPREYSQLIKGEYDEKIWFRHVYYDRANDNFRMLFEGEYEPLNILDSDNLKNRKLKLRQDLRINIANYTGEIVSNLQLDRRGEERINIPYPEFNKKYYPTIKKFTRTTDVGDNRRYTNHVLGNDFINIKNFPTTLNGEKYESRAGINVPVGFVQPETTVAVVQEFFKEATNTELEAIKSYESTINTIALFNKNGLFNITSEYFKDKIIRNIMIPVSGRSEKDLAYKQLYNVKIDSLNLNFDKSLLSSNIQDLYLSVFKALSDQYTNLDISKGDIVTGSIDLISQQHLYFKNLNAVDKGDRYFLKPEILFANNQGQVENYDIGNALRFDDALRAYDADLENNTLKVIRNPKYTDYYKQNYSNIIKLDLNSDIRYKNCNVYPHYLNLDYFLNLAAQSAKQNLCDTNMDEIPKIILEEIIINLTMRTYVTDLLVKVIPLLSLFDNNELKNLYKEQFIVDILRQHIIQEMHIFTNNVKVGDPQDYYSQFIDLLRLYFYRPENAKKIKEKYILSTSAQGDKEIDYFIRKEMSHFIAFSLDKNMISPLQESLYKTFQKTSTMPQELVKNEFYTLFSYFLMACTVDLDKRCIFNGTKSELVRIFFKHVTSTGQIKGVYQEKSQEDILKFINNIAFSPNPAALIYLNPDYSKYVRFFIDAVRQETKSTLKITALQTDPNIMITRAINYGLSTAGAVSWSLLDPEYRNKVLIEASVRNRPLAYLYKRFDSALSPVPDALVSLGVAGFGVFPNNFGISYLALDTIDEIDWVTKTTQELDELAKFGLNDQDPCQVIDINTDVKCRDNTQNLRNEIDKYE